MLESIALAAGYRVGLYSKPHLVHFEERCRIGGQSVDARRCCRTSRRSSAARGDVSLTYFEFTLLAIASLFAATPLDLVILEVGLGGRLDAVNAFDGDCAVITSIDVDHVEYLGTGSRIDRAREGGHHARRQAGDRQRPGAAAQRARRGGADRRRPVARRRATSAIPAIASSGTGRAATRASAASATRRCAARTSCSTPRACSPRSRPCATRLPVSAQAIRTGLATVELPGRFQVVPGEPTIVLDVAHNPHAVAALALNLDQMGFFPRTHAVFGAMRDKDIDAILARMAPLVDALALHRPAGARARRARTQIAERFRALGAKGAGRDRRDAREPERRARRGDERRGPR